MTADRPLSTPRRLLRLLELRERQNCRSQTPEELRNRERKPIAAFSLLLFVRAPAPSRVGNLSTENSEGQMKCQLTITFAAISLDEKISLSVVTLDARG